MPIFFDPLDIVNELLQYNFIVISRWHNVVPFLQVSMHRKSLVTLAYFPGEICLALRFDGTHQRNLSPYYEKIGNLCNVVTVLRANVKKSL